jgi:hypothetical protein
MLRVTLRRASTALAAAATAIGLSAAPAPLTALAVSPAETPTQVGVTGGSGGSGAVFTKQDLLPFSPSSGFAYLGGILIAAPAVASVPDPNGVAAGQPLFIGTGQDHALWVRTLSQPWQHLSSSFNYCIDNPAAVVVSAHAAGQLLLTVACQGQDHGLWYGQETVAPGVLPSQNITFATAGGVLTAGPAVAPVDPNNASGVDKELTFFGRGQDGHIWTENLFDRVWIQMPWQCIGHPAAGGSLSTFNTLAYTEITVFACQGLDHSLWTARNFGAGWETAFSWGGVLVDGPGIAVTPTWVTAYVEGQNTHVWQLSFSPQQFTGWIDQGGSVQFGAGAAALLYRPDNP